jgi:hypothetical protein
MKPPAPFDWQQPLAQFIGPQLSTMPSQVCDTASHVVKPCAGQFSHACPSLPHAVKLLPTWHAPLLSQHPVAQVPGPHVPGAAHTPAVALQVVPAVQVAQAAPWIPHARLDFPGKQRPAALQQPSGHESTSQVAPSRFAPSPALSRAGASVGRTSCLASGSEPSGVAKARMSVRSPHPAEAASVRTTIDRIESNLARRVGLRMVHS